MFYGNLYILRVIITYWIACHERLATKTRLHKFGVVVNEQCCFCIEPETQQHLLFYCREVKAIWKKVLSWIQIPHEPEGCDHEVKWILHNSKGKGPWAKMIKLSATECIYEVWQYKNGISYGNDVHNKKIDEKIIDLQ